MALLDNEEFWGDNQSLLNVIWEMDHFNSPIPLTALHYEMATGQIFQSTPGLSILTLSQETS